MSPGGKRAVLQTLRTRVVVFYKDSSVKSKLKGKHRRKLETAFVSTPKSRGRAKQMGHGCAASSRASTSHGLLQKGPGRFPGLTVTVSANPTAGPGPAFRGGSLGRRLVGGM